MATLRLSQEAEEIWNRVNEEWGGHFAFLPSSEVLSISVAKSLDEVERICGEYVETEARKLVGLHHGCRGIVRLAEIKETFCLIGDILLHKGKSQQAPAWGTQDE